MSGFSQVPCMLLVVASMAGEWIYAMFALYAILRPVSLDFFE